MKKFWLGVLKTIGMVVGQTVPAVVSAVNPPLGALTASLVNSILSAESKFGPGTGPQKKDHVLGNVDAFAPMILAAIEKATGRELADDAKFASGIDKVTDGLCDILESMGALPKGAQP